MKLLMTFSTRISYEPKVKNLETASDEDVIKTCDEAWEDLRQGLEDSRRWHEALTDETLALLRRAKQIEQRGPRGLGPEEQDRLAKLADLLHGPNLIQNLGQVQQIVIEHEQAYRDAWTSTAQELRDRVTRAAEELRERFKGLEDAVLEEALRPLRELSPTPDASPDTGPALETLRSRLANLPTTTERIEQQLLETTTTHEVAHLRLRDLYPGPITSEEELEALVARLRQAVQDHLAQGKHVVVE